MQQETINDGVTLIKRWKAATRAICDQEERHNTCHDRFTVIHNGRTMSKKVSKPGMLLFVSRNESRSTRARQINHASIESRELCLRNAECHVRLSAFCILHERRSTRFSFRSTFSAYGCCIVLRGDCVNSESFCWRFACSAFSGRLAKSVRCGWFRVQTSLPRSFSSFLFNYIYITSFLVVLW